MLPTTTLADALPRAEFIEHHVRVVDAPPGIVWEALGQANWSDLRLTRPLLLARGLVRLDGARVLDGGPVQVVTTSPGRYVAGGRIAKPWRPVPTPGPDVESLEQLARFEDPGWLKFGMDFRLDPLPDGRTRLTTWTLCEPTDAAARRSFGRYWRIIRPFSGLIRRDLLRTVARRAEAAARPPRRSGTTGPPPD